MSKADRFLLKNKNKEIPNFILNFKVCLKYCTAVLEALKHILNNVHPLAPAARRASAGLLDCILLVGIIVIFYFVLCSRNSIENDFKGYLFFFIYDIYLIIFIYLFCFNTIFK